MIKQYLSNLKLKPLHNLTSAKIYALPSRISDKDILALFNGLLNLLRQKTAQENQARLLNLQLKYDRLKYLYNKTKKNTLNK